jgi:uncharacterized protein (DUF427 family)
MNEKKIETGDEQESVWDYPRPPRIEPVKQAIKIELNGVVIAESSSAKRVLEKGHPPVYYLPMEDINAEVLRISSRRTW